MMENNYLKFRNQIFSFFYKKILLVFLFCASVLFYNQNGYSQCNPSQSSYYGPYDPTQAWQGYGFDNQYSSMYGGIGYPTIGSGTLSSNYIYQWSTYYPWNTGYDTQLTLYPACTELYAGNCGSYLAYNDDYGGTLQSTIAYRPGYTAVQLIVQQYPCNNASYISYYVGFRGIPYYPATPTASVYTVCPGAAVTLYSNIGFDNDVLVNVEWGTSPNSSDISTDATNVTVYPTSTTTYYVRYLVLAGTTPGNQYSYGWYGVTINVDQTPPSTPATFSTTWSGDHYVCGDFNTTVPTTSGATYYRLCRSADNNSGCNTWVNGGATYTAGQVVTVSGSDLPSANTFRYYMWYAYDDCGNQSAAGGQDYVRMDGTGPPAPSTFTTTWCGDHYVTSSFVTYAPTEVDAGVGGTYYRLMMSSDNSGSMWTWVNGGATYSPGQAVTVSGGDLPSNNTFRYYWWYAWDACGNGSGYGNPDYVRMGGPQGSTFSNPFFVGTLGCTPYSDTKNNCTGNCFTNDIGNASDDIYYQFSLGQTAIVNLSHCSTSFDTYMYLLNSGGSILASDDDYGPLCGGLQASIQTTLSAGTYYLVSEGYSGNCGDLISQISIPLPTGTISGSSTVCSGNTGVSYSYSNTAANSYTWTVPFDAFVASGQGTPNITVNWGSTSGNVSCTAVNGPCSAGAVDYYVTVNALSDAGTLTQSPASGSSVCSGTGVTYTQSGGTGTFTRLEYQWNGTGGGWSVLSYSNSYTWTAGNPGNTLYVRAVVTNGICPEAYSSPVSVYIANPPVNDNCADAIVISGIPYNSGVMSTQCASDDYTSGSGCGGYSSNVWFKVTGTGYRMEANTCDGNTNFDTEIHIYSGSCGTFTEVNCDDDGCGVANRSKVLWCSSVGTTYYISVGYYWTPAVYGNYVLTVLDYPLGTPTGVSANNSTICAGGSVTLSATPGTNGDDIYWYSNGCGSGFVGSGTSINVTPGSTTTYYANTYNTTCGTISSGCGSVTVTVVADPVAQTITAVPVSGTTVCVGAVISATFSGGSGGIGAISDTYEYSTNEGVGWSAYTPGNNITTTAPGTNIIQIRTQRTATGPGCDASSYNYAMWTVVDDPSVIISGTTNICTGGTTTLNAAPSGGTGTFNYQWQLWNGSSWENIGGNSSSYTTSALTSTTDFQCILSATGSGCGNATSNTLTITVFPDPVAPTAIKSPNVATVCEGQTLTLVGLNDNGGGTGSCNIWYSSNGGAWTTSLPSFTSTVGTNTIDIKKVCDGAGCGDSPVSSYSWNVVADPVAPTAFKLPNVLTVCVGQTLTLGGITDNGGGTGSCIIEYSMNGGGWTSTLTPITAAEGTNTIAIRKTCDGLSCGSSPVNTYSWTAVPDPATPTATRSPNVDNICVGQTLALSGVTDNGGGTGTCNIEYSINGGAWTTASPNFAAIAGTNTIAIRKKCNGLGCDVSGINTYTWTAFPTPVAPTATKSPDLTSVCIGQSLTLTGVTDNGGGTGTCNIEYSLNGGAWVTSLTPITAAAGTNTIAIRKTCDGLGCNSSSVNTYTWTAVADPTISISGSPLSFCSGGTSNLSATPSGGTGTYTYQWQYWNGTSWVNTGTNSSSYTTFALTSTTDFQCLYIPTAGGCNTITSNIQTITITPSVGTPTLIGILAGTEPGCQLTNGTTTTTYTTFATNSTGFNWSVSNPAAGNIDPVTGVMTWNNGFSGSVDIQVTANGCGGPSSQVIRTVNITPTVGIPVFVLGATSSICSGSSPITYTANATNSTGMSYTLDPASLAGGNTIISTTGEVTYNPAWTGTTTVTAHVAGCNGPLTADHVVTIVQTVGTPVFALGSTSVICQGSAPVTYTATATGSTSISYSLDAASIAGGNNINPLTGQVTYDPSWTGTTIVTAIAAGCNGPSQASHTVTITPTVGTPVFVSGSSSVICQGSVNTTYTANATNSTAITYYLSTAGSSSINPLTGEVTWDPAYNGQATITASAAGCNGPATADHVVTITPTVGTPVFVLGASSVICLGSSPVTYTANATNSTGITYSLDPASLAGGNTIILTTGQVTYNPSWTGTTTVTASAAGCNGPKTANHIVTITPAVGTPVFVLGGTSTICQASTPVTYTANSSNTTGITYSLSVAGSSSINPLTGEVTWDPAYNGQATVTASAAGCNGPVTANHVVTITPTVGTPVFVLGSSSTICIGSSPVTYTANATNSTGMSYSLDAASLAGGNSINSTTGEVTYNASWTGTSIITASASGCNGPVTAIHTVTINAIVPVNVGITAVPPGAVCSGTLVTFTANTINAGTSPTYQWRLNGNIVGGNNSTYSNSSLLMGDHIVCQLTSDMSCVSNNPATSGTITMIVKPSLTAGITIEAQSNPSCSHTVVYFTAYAANGGTTPAYQWYLNSNPVGGNSSTYSNNSLTDGNVISCRLTSDEACVISNPAYSNNIIMIMGELPAVNAGSDGTYSGVPIQIGSAISGPGTFSWQPASGLSNASIAQPYASPIITTVYTLTVNNNGCTATDAVTVNVAGSGHIISGKTRYAGKAIAGNPAPNQPTYNPVIYNINKVIVILKSYPASVELARDTSDGLGFYQFNNVANGTYKLSYDKYTADTMQTGNDVNAIDVALMKYLIGSDTLTDPSRNFSSKYRKAANVDNNTSINAVDVARIKAKIGSPYAANKNFPKGNWVALDTVVTMAGADLLNVTLKTICYGDYNASSSKYKDSVATWGGAKSLPDENIVIVSDESVITTDPSFFEVPLRISSKINDFSAMGLELSYPYKEYKLVSASMPKTGSKDTPVKINPTLDEIITDNNDLLVTDENGVIRVVYATTNNFDVAPNDEMINFGFRALNEMNQGEIEFNLSGTGVIADKYGEQNGGTYLLMPKIFVQGNNNEAGFEFSGYPNPFNGDATIYYNIPENGAVKLKVYNVIGDLVSELVDENQLSGRHTVVFSPKNLPAGMYTFKLEFSGLDKSKFLILKMIH